MDESGNIPASRMSQHAQKSSSVAVSDDALLGEITMGESSDHESNQNEH